MVTPEGYTFVTKFQEDNSHKVLRSVDFFSIKFDEIFFDTVCWDNSSQFLFRESSHFAIHLCHLLFFFSVVLLHQ